MNTQWLTNSIILGAIATAGITLMLRDVQPSGVPLEFERTLTTASHALEQAQNQVVLGEIRWLEGLGRLEALPKPVTIPFDYVGGHILISAQMDEIAQAKTVILDSGLRSTILDSALQSDLTLSVPLQVDKKAVYGLLKQVRVAEANFRDIGTFVVDFSAPNQPLYCLSDSGVMGASMMRHGIWQINYTKQTLTLTDSLQNLGNMQTAIAIPFELVDLRPMLDLKVSPDKTIQTVVDTGWGGSIYLAEKDLITLDRRQLMEVSTLEGLVETLRGLEVFRQKTLQIPHLSLGSLALENFPVLVSEGQSVQPDSLIGNAFLENFIVTLDWSANQLYLQPIAPVDDWAPQAPSYGFQALVYDQSLRITGLYDPSPATQAGLQIGDRILAINHDRYTHLKDEHFCTFVRSPVGDLYSGSITMTVERQGQPLTYTLHQTVEP